MPIYEYQCNACGHRLESFQKMTDAPLTECPECHKSTLQKLISAAGFQLKGTGWYATDFKEKGKKDPKTEAKKDNSPDKTETTGNGSQDAKDTTTR
ncbi:MAG TPA: zinc ribbon domain-containing protein [Gammaproteobacteria bacterium]|jgi:putative FmdB family regulatory protein|nr:zinc ribbon domain-containing protein [Gammaproteobacteria bacterium]